MNKILLGAITLIPFTIIIVSADVKPFIGTNITQHKTTLSDYTQTKLDISVKIGIMDDTWRVYGTHETIFKGILPGVIDYIDYSAYTINADMIQEITKETDIYFGLHAGYGNGYYVNNEYNGWYNGGPQYGGQVGILYHITKGFTTEAGIKYSMCVLSDSYNVLNATNVSLLTGINYKF